MNFYPIETSYIYIGQPCLYSNNIYFDSYSHGDRVVQFGGWAQELNVDSQTNTIVSFEAIFSENELNRCHLTPPTFVDAKIKLDKVTDMKPMRIHYDNNNGWFCFGKRTFRGNGYRFATDTIAVIYNNTLEAIFIKPLQKNK